MGHIFSMNQLYWVSLPFKGNINAAYGLYWIRSSVAFQMNELFCWSLNNLTVGIRWSCLVFSMEWWDIMLPAVLCSVRGTSLLRCSRPFNIHLKWQCYVNCFPWIKLFSYLTCSTIVVDLSRIEWATAIFSIWKLNLSLYCRISYIF